MKKMSLLLFGVCLFGFVTVQAGPLKPTMGDEWPLAVDADSFEPIQHGVELSFVNQSGPEQDVIGHCMHATWLWDPYQRTYFHHHVQLVLVPSQCWNGCHWVPCYKQAYQHFYERAFYYPIPNHFWKCPCNAIHLGD